MLRRCVGLGVSSVLLIASPAQAGVALGVGTDLFRVIEIVVPDLRLEFPSTQPTPFLVLSWPVVFRLPAPDSHLVFPEALLEPQYVPAQNAWRALGGARLLFPFDRRRSDTIGAMVEGGGLLGVDGSGGFVGAGLSGLDGTRAEWLVLGVGYRFTLLTDSYRHDVTIDLLNLPF